MNNELKERMQKAIVDAMIKIDSARYPANKIFDLADALIAAGAIFPKFKAGEEVWIIGQKRNEYICCESCGHKEVYWEDKPIKAYIQSYTQYVKCRTYFSGELVYTMFSNETQTQYCDRNGTDVYFTEAEAQAALDKVKGGVRG